jgi:hypothetical protein
MVTTPQGPLYDPLGDRPGLDVLKKNREKMTKVFKALTSKTPVGAAVKFLLPETINVVKSAANRLSKLYTKKNPKVVKEREDIVQQTFNDFIKLQGRKPGKAEFSKLLSSTQNIIKRDKLYDKLGLTFFKGDTAETLARKSKVLTQRNIKKAKNIKVPTAVTERVNGNPIITGLRFKNISQEKKFTSLVKEYFTYPRQKAPEELFDKFKKLYENNITKNTLTGHIGFLGKKLNLKRPSIVDSPLSYSQSLKMRDIKQKSPVDLDAAHIAGVDIQNSGYALSKGDLPEGITSLGGNLFARGTEKLKPSYLTTWKRNQIAHVAQEKRLMELLTIRQNLLDKLGTTKSNDVKNILYKNLNNNQTTIDKLNSVMIKFRNQTVIKDPVTGKLKYYGMQPESASKITNLKMGQSGTTPGAKRFYDKGGRVGYKEGNTVKKEFKDLTEDEKEEFLKEYEEWLKDQDKKMEAAANRQREAMTFDALSNFMERSKRGIPPVDERTGLYGRANPDVLDVNLRKKIADDIYLQGGAQFSPNGDPYYSAKVSKTFKKVAV